MSKHCPDCGEEHEDFLEVDGDYVRDTVFDEVPASFPPEEQERAKEVLQEIEALCMENDHNVIDTIFGMVKVADKYPNQGDEKFLFSKRVFAKVIEVVEELALEVVEAHDGKLVN